ncbi:22444_t:CDS:2 [Dentiscutata erythropus]|uniref:22444_t:CDS:1 n=1 Tax=Dentiscutata erythropus TaxID=1348616 RepID=A0A9N9DYA8_9GLOM|nr:22444_t:CDS:2 [Dentiscutata erythropus]
MAGLISFKDVFKIDKEKLSFITEDDMRFAWHYITLFYNNEPCSLDEEAYTINIDKNVLFNDNRIEEIEVENDGIRDYYKLKDDVGHYFILYNNSVIKHIGTYNYFDYYDIEDNISEKIFIKNV